MSDNIPHHGNKCMPVMYAVFYPRLKEIAEKHGYALAVHGSFTKDMDLIAAPWTEQANNPEQMIVEMAKSIYESDRPEMCLAHSGKKPHGRIAYTIVCGGGGWIDISVMPLGSKT